MRAFCVSILLIAFCCFQSSGQASNKNRTRAVDYTQFDQLLNGLAYAPDKIKAAKKLLDVTTTLFTPEDEEYFVARQMVVSYYEMAYDHAHAMELVLQALEAYEKYYP